MPKLYHISLALVRTLQSPQTLDPIISRAGYWARLSVFDWYVWSYLTPWQVYDEIATDFDPADTIVVTPVDLSQGERSVVGWAPEWFWEFMRDGWKHTPPAS